MVEVFSGPVPPEQVMVGGFFSPFFTGPMPPELVMLGICTGPHHHPGIGGGGGGYFCWPPTPGAGDAADSY